MSLEDGLYTHMSNDSGIGPVIGGPANPRIYPMQLPDGVIKPAITTHRIDGPRTHRTQENAKIIRPRIRVNCWDVTYEGAVALAGLVVSSLDGRRKLGWCESALVDGDQDTFEPDTRLYRRYVEIVFQEAA